VRSRDRVAASLASVTLAAAIGCVALGLRAADYHPKIDPARFQSTIDHPYFPMTPGTTFEYVEKSLGETSENEVTVTHQTKTILGVSCVEVHDVVTERGEVTEDSYRWVAQDRDGSVWCFGEATQEIGAGGAVSTAGSWEAGVDGAEPGILMPASPRPGEPYHLGYSFGVAEDMGRIDALGDSVAVPVGTFADCVRTTEWSLLEPGSEKRWYARGVGLVRSESISGEVAVLVSITRE
jgi:hypothetical protein